MRRRKQNTPISLMLRGNQCQVSRHIEEAVACFESARTALEQYLSRGSESPRAMRQLCFCLARLGKLAIERGPDSDARNHCERNLAVTQGLAVRVARAPDSLRTLVQAHKRLGDLERKAGQIEAARAQFEQILVINREFVDQCGRTSQALWDQAVGLLKIGDLDWEEGRLTCPPPAVPS